MLSINMNSFPDKYFKKDLFSIDIHGLLLNRIERKRKKKTLINTHIVIRLTSYR